MPEKNKIVISDELPTYKKAMIGAIGGFGLALLKLIENGFFISASYNEILVGYLTYGVYIILGIIVATFFTDHDLPKQKCKKHAFMMGLLAPSILIAIITGPNVNKTNNNTGSTIKDISTLSFNFSIINSAYAEPVMQHKPLIQQDSEVSIKYFNKEEFEPSVKQAFFNVIGRPVDDTNFTLVIGVSKSQEKAKKVASNFNKLLDCNDNGIIKCAKLLIPEGKNKVYVSVGDFNAIESAKSLKSNIMENLLQSLEITPDKDKTKLTSLISKGRIIKGTEFFK